MLPAALAIAFSDVVVDALMVQTGQPQGLTGRLQSIQWASIYAATILTGVTGGALSQWGMQQTGFLIAGVFCGVSFLAVCFLVREPARPGRVADARHLPSLRQAAPSARCGRTFRQPAILTIGAFLFMWNFNPFSMTVLYYYATETLHFDEQFAGSLTSYQAIGAVLGSILYGIVCRAIPVRWLVHASIVAGILATLAYWGYRDAASAVHVSLAVGLVYMFGTLVQLDLAARVCRPQTAGTTFALLMSLINLSALLSQGLGGSLYETMTHHWGSAAAFQILVGIGALFTAGCWLLLPLMRRTLFAQVEQANAELELASIAPESFASHATRSPSPRWGGVRGGVKTRVDPSSSRSLEPPDLRLGELQAVAGRIAEIDRAPARRPLEVRLDRHAHLGQPAPPRLQLRRRGAEAHMPLALHAVRRHRQRSPPPAARWWRSD